MSKICSDNSQSIGNTPLVKLNHIIGASKATILAKVEGRNRLIVGEREELTTFELTAVRAIWNISRHASEFHATCRIRYRHTPAPCRVVLQDEGTFSVYFDTPQTSVTPGQAAVLYDGEAVLGGGWIK